MCSNSFADEQDSEYYWLFKQISNFAYKSITKIRNIFTKPGTCDLSSDWLVGGAGPICAVLGQETFQRVRFITASQDLSLVAWNDKEYVQIDTLLFRQIFA